MNLQQLRYFVAISQFGHYGQAAKALYVTQSALSNSIKKLEGELGVRLFEHQGRNAVLTDRGKVFAARISPILNDLDNAISEIQADTEARQNKAKLGAVAALMRGVLSSLLNSYNENAEEPILFDLSHMGSTKECEQNLLNDTLDIAFCGNPAKPNELNWIPLFPENAIVAVSSSHPLAKMQSVSLTDLRNYKQLSYREPSYMYYAFCGMFKKYNLSPQPAFEDEIAPFRRLASTLTLSQSCLTRSETWHGTPLSSSVLKNFSVLTIGSEWLTEINPPTKPISKHSYLKWSHCLKACRG